MNNIGWMLPYYGTLTTLTLLVVFFDKHQAIHNRTRIREATLWMFSMLGGCLGMYISMHIFHHKTRKLRFKLGVFALCLMHLIIIGYLLIQQQST